VRYLIVCLLTLSACASQHVSDAGSGRHSLTATSTHGLLAARDRAVALANKYCGKSGQQALVAGFTDETLAVAVGDPTTTVVFTCGARNTTALSR
jgi:hypothetical protein